MNIIYYFIKVIVKCVWVLTFIGGLYYINFFDQPQSSSTSWSGLILCPIIFFCISGLCSRLLWEGFGLARIYDESMDQQYLILTTRLLELFTGKFLENLLVGLTEYVRGKVDT